MADIGLIWFTYWAWVATERPFQWSQIVDMDNISDGVAMWLR